MKELQELAESVVDEARDAGATEVVAEAVDSFASQVRFSNCEVDSVNSWNEKHVMLFVAVGKRTMSSDLRDIGRARELVREVVAAARHCPPSKSYKGIASGRFAYTRVRPDPKIVHLKDPGRFVHEAIGASEREGAYDVGGALTQRLENIGIASSGGASAWDESASLCLSVRAFSQPEASGHAVCCASRLSRMRAKETGAKAGQHAAAAKNPVLGDEGRADLVLEPLCLGSLTHSVTLMMSALRVEIGTSIFAKKIGKPVASRQVTFVDDPATESISRRAFDHEGVPTRKNIVVKDGVLKTYLHNTSSARRFGTRTTANAGPFIPTLWNLAAQPVPFHPSVLPGDWSLDEIVSDTQHGLYINNTWYTRYQNYGTGEFSTIPRDALLRIENGEIVGSVKNIRISDNMLQFLKSVDAVSRQSQEVEWWDEIVPASTLPFVRARGVTITRSS